MPISWYKGREERKRQASQIIFSMLPEDMSEVTWSQLEEKAAKERMSTTTLSAHLKDFKKKRLVDRRVDTSVHPPRVYYRRTYDYEQQYLLLEKGLASVKEQGIDIDEFVIARTKALFGWMMFLLISMTIEKAVGISKASREWKNKGFTLEAFEKSKNLIQAMDKNEAHDILDTLVDLHVRPHLHEILEFCYLQDPRDGKPILYNYNLWGSLLDVETVVLSMGVQAEEALNYRAQMETVKEMKRRSQTDKTAESNQE